MSVIRTSLSLITFGFTIFEGFRKLVQAGALAEAHAPRNFGLALVALGIVLLTLGIYFHVRFMNGLRQERKQMKSLGLIHGESIFPPSMTLVTAILLLLIGIIAIISMVIRF